MHSSRSRIGSRTSEDSSHDLYKKFKLKNYNASQSFDYRDTMDIDSNDESTDDCTRSATSNELDFDEYYSTRTLQPANSAATSFLLTPNIEELQRKEKELMSSLNKTDQVDACFLFKRAPISYFVSIGTRFIIYGK